IFLVSPSDACDLTLDPNTANKKLSLSEGNKKAKYGQSQSYPDHPERFMKYPQVLCKEGLSGCHYWEVDWGTSSKEIVYVAVAYKRIDRARDSSDSKFGKNTTSWTFGKYSSTGEHVLEAHHIYNVWNKSFIAATCDRIGVYLDWYDGTLSFYKVSSDTLTHLYTFRTTFTEPVYPGFWIGRESFAFLRPLK
ncbi:neoverrucotoxin subunit alpha-like, partial [Plectropomus leopardus]|uniref:neoverrucotoxin subunit alpha-like n=1 Tax=Plectropomus leopardus TaxID=160734 RepID=UPI001C4AFD72